MTQQRQRKKEIQKLAAEKSQQAQNLTHSSRSILVILQQAPGYRQTPSLHNLIIRAQSYRATQLGGGMSEKSSFFSSVNDVSLLTGKTT